EIPQPVAQAGLRCQPLLALATQAGGSGSPALRAEGDAAVGKALQARRLLELPALLRRRQARLFQLSLPVPARIPAVQSTRQAQLRLQRITAQLQGQRLGLQIAVAGERQAAPVGVAVAQAFGNQRQANLPLFRQVALEIEAGDAGLAVAKPAAGE